MYGKIYMRFKCCGMETSLMPRCLSIQAAGMARIMCRNYRLAIGSPCINAGHNQYAPTNVTPYDLMGMGALNGTVIWGPMNIQSLSLKYRCL